MIRNANEEISDAFIRHQIYLLRHAGWWRNRILRLLRKAERDFISSINADKKKTLSARRFAVYKALAEIKRENWDSIIKLSETYAKELTAYEASYNQRVLEGSVPVVLNITVPPIQQLQGLVRRKPFGGKTMRAWLKKLASDDVVRLKSIVSAGILEGKPTQSVIRDARGLFNLTQRQTEAVIRTAISNISNNVRERIIEDNSDIVKEVEFVATLDSRTTLQCASLDGRRFKIGKAPVPPLHYQCRSTLVPVILPDAVVDRPAKPFVRQEFLEEYKRSHNLKKVSSYDDLPRGHKTSFRKYERQRIAELTTRVPGKTTYGEFLSKQSREFQIEVLGAKRAKLFREGGLTLDKFVDRKGNVLNLKRLRLLEESAFRKTKL